MVEKLDIAIFGAGNAGKYLYSQIRDCAEDIKVVAFVDNNLRGQEIEGINILSPKDAFSEITHVDAVFIAAGAQKTLKYMVNTCRDNGIDDIYMLHDVAGKEKLQLFIDGKIDETKIRKLRFSEEKPSLHYFEVPITDSCNLNCKGCLFACNVVGGGSMFPLNCLLLMQKGCLNCFMMCLG